MVGLLDLIERVGTAISESELSEIRSDLDLTGEYYDPPARRYLDNESKGLCLLFSDKILFDIQIFVRPTETYSEYVGELPYGLTRGLRQLDVHNLLGEPTGYREGQSKYIKPDDKIKLIVEYNKQGIMRYISISSTMDLL